MSKRYRADAKPAIFDTELADLPADLRWREWMNRIEAVLFASSRPVEREALARIVGRDASIELLIDDVQAGLVGKPYEVSRIAGGWRMQTRVAYADTIHASMALPERAMDLTERGHSAGVDRLSSADHPGRRVRDPRTGGVARRDRSAAGQEYDHRGAAQPDRRSAFYLCDDQGVLGAFRARHIAGLARFGGDAGRRTAERRPGRWKSRADPVLVSVCRWYRNDPR